MHNLVIKLKGIYIAYFFLLIAPTFVCTIVLKQIPIIAVIIAFFLSAVSIYVQKKIVSDSYFKSIQILYFLPITISLFSCTLALINYNDTNFYIYYSKFLPTRIINIIFYWTITTFLYSIFIKQKNYQKILYIYSIGIFIAFAIIGLCQIMAMVLNLPFPDFGTRTHLHSISLPILPNLKRITSIADEPSYLVPFLIDATLIFIFLRKYILATILVLLCVCSLSFGGYVNIFLLGCFYLFLNRKKIKVKYIYTTLFFLSIILITLGKYLLPLFEIILNRREFSSNFEASDSARTSVISLIFEFIKESNWVYILFGHGPSSFKYLNLSKTLYDGSPFHTTSNNLFVDIAYEGGLFSLFCIILLFARLYYIFNKKEKKNNKNIIFLSKILIAHLFLTSMYRADYVSPRFFSILLILGLLYKICKNDFHYNSNLPT